MACKSVRRVLPLAIENEITQLLYHLYRRVGLPPTFPSVNLFFAYVLVGIELQLHAFR